MNKKIKLSVLGFSFNQSQTGTYGLVLAEVRGLRRLMVVIGTPEAQSIAFKLHKAEPPRPITHDLFQNLLNQLDVQAQEIFIYKYKDGVFFSKLVLKHNERIFEIESRTSDAVAIALRAKCSIYTTPEIMEELGVVFSDSEEETKFESSPQEIEKNSKYHLFQTDDLENVLKEALINEDYELASIVRDEIAKKKTLRMTE